MRRKFSEQAFAKDRFITVSPVQISIKLREEDDTLTLRDVFQKALIIETKVSPNCDGVDKHANCVYKLNPNKYPRKKKKTTMRRIQIRNVSARSSCGNTSHISSVYKNQKLRKF